MTKSSAFVTRLESITPARPTLSLTLSLSLSLAYAFPPLALSVCLWPDLRLAYRIFFLSGMSEFFTRKKKSRLSTLLWPAMLLPTKCTFQLRGRI